MNPQAIQATADRYATAIHNKMKEYLGDNWVELLNRPNIIWNMDRMARNCASVYFIMRDAYPEHMAEPQWLERLPYVWVEHLTKVDPTPKSIYTKWILARWLAGDFGLLIEDVVKAHQPLSLFNVLKPMLEVQYRDIQRFKSLEALEAFVLQYSHMEYKSKKQQDRDLGAALITSGEAVLIHDDEELKIISPKTKTASCYFGRNTRWCTATDSLNLNYFESYASQGPLYIILFKKENRRWQFHFESGQLMDEQDREIPIATIRKSIVHQHFDWKEIARRNYQMTPLYLEANREQRARALSYAGSLALDFIRLTRSEKMMAIRSYPEIVVEDRRFRYTEMRKIALSRMPDLLERIENPTYDEIKNAINSDGRAIRFVPLEMRTADLCALAVQRTQRYDPEIERRRIRRERHAPRPVQDDSEPKHPIYYVPAHFIDQRMMEYHMMRSGTEVSLLDFEYSRIEEYNHVYRVLQETILPHCSYSQYVVRNTRLHKELDAIEERLHRLSLVQYRPRRTQDLLFI